eukprot:SAG11_NODE_5058_length_1677_cov_1.302915_1_plen_242_part_10
MTISNNTKTEPTSVENPANRTVGGQTAKGQVGRRQTTDNADQPDRKLHRNLILRQTSRGFEAIPQPEPSATQLSTDERNKRRTATAYDTTAQCLAIEHTKYGQSKFDRKQRRPKKRKEVDERKGAREPSPADAQIAQIATGIQAGKRTRSSSRGSSKRRQDRFNVPVVKAGGSKPSAMVVEEVQDEGSSRNIPRPQPVAQGRITRRMAAMKAAPPTPGKGKGIKTPKPFHTKCNVCGNPFPK